MTNLMLLTMALLSLASSGCGKEDKIGSAMPLIKDTMSCFTTQTVGGIAVFLKYDSVVFNSGDRFLACKVIIDGETETFSTLYPKGNREVGTGKCEVYFDLEGDSSGKWLFGSYPSETGYAVYEDSGSASDSYTYGFQTWDCKR